MFFGRLSATAVVKTVFENNSLVNVAQVNNADGTFSLTITNSSASALRSPSVLIVALRGDIVGEVE